MQAPNHFLQLINDFPSLFQIESNKKVFYSPFLQQLFGECSARNEETNDGLEKLTNRQIDNQSLSLPKNKELKQEQRTTKEKKRKPSPQPLTRRGVRRRRRLFDEEFRRRRNFEAGGSSS